MNLINRRYYSSSVFEEQSPKPKRNSRQEFEVFDKIQFTPIHGPPPDDDLPFLSTSSRFHIGKQSYSKRKHTSNRM